MAVTDVNGTQTAVIGTEHTLADTSAAATYQLTVLLTNMQALDVLELRIYKMTLTGGVAGANCFIETRFDGAQPNDDIIAMSIPVSTALTDSGAIRATLKQTAGTGRPYKWTLEKFA